LHADRRANDLDRKETGGYLLKADPQWGPTSPSHKL
jgi:hypothetical protein